MPVPDNAPPRKPQQSLRAALELYDRHGLNPLAAALRTKVPLGEWRRWQTERRPRREVEVAFGRPRNIWVPCGALAPGRLLALDCDSEEAVELWRERLGGVLDETACQRTGRGMQFLFLAPEGEAIRGVDGREPERPETEWEIKGDGQGVILPPSVHPSGRVYTWVRGMPWRADAPAELLEAAREASRGAEEASAADRSKLADLWQSPAVSGGRNNWLAAVAGHLARHIPYRDAYEVMVHTAASMCKPPLTDEDVETPGELSKLVKSIWDTEQARRANLPPEPRQRIKDPWQRAVVEPSEATGFLCTGGDKVLAQQRQNEEIRRVQWMDADLRVLGVTVGEQERNYLVEVHQSDQEPRQAKLPAAAVAGTRDLATWLSRYGVSIGHQPGLWPRLEITPGARLLRYLEAQQAPEAKVVPHLGHFEGDFLTNDEVIREAGASQFETVRPDPSIGDWAPYHYGHAPLEETQAALRRVLEFHHEMVTAVFGAWWAAVLIKPLIMERVSQFPIIGLEAPSESGKTTGFFELMHQLSGWSGSQINPTRAALRDYLSAHNAGYVWVDDLDVLGDREELLRQVTVGGSLAKKAGDHQGQQLATMRAGLAISGESLGLGGQKALLDRVVLLEVPSPKERMSQDGRRSQWDEIVEFRTEHPDLNRYAGTLVRAALRQAERVRELSELRIGPGRHGDKIAVLRLGARLLDALAAQDFAAERVDAWCRELEDLGAENSLTLRILPWALSQTEWRERPTGPDDYHGKVATPALVDKEDTVWFSPRLLAAWWARHRRGQISQRTDTEEALTQQAKALGLGGQVGIGRKNVMFVGGSGKAKYWRCTPEISRLVLERSRS